ncbi:MAG: hypothetical protein EZS28_005247 [Streblomastix strix]|uniref:Uncharacterized protein n=1 Tax=Streblomastix strix TaxID=222440 RepID=A0A5J4WYF0_9EUKA|nr:MAG: hypothetical protein EZS28_005247 [Streblomastix strix]
MPFESLFEPLTANITVVIDALEQLHIDWKSIWKIIYEAVRVDLSKMRQLIELMKYNQAGKVKQYEKINKERVTKPTQIKDAKVKPLNKLQRPYFSPKLGSWEIDLVFVVIPMIEKSAAQIKLALKKLISQVYVNNIRGDGETAQQNC